MTIIETMYNLDFKESPRKNYDNHSLEYLLEIIRDMDFYIDMLRRNDKDSEAYWEIRIPQIELEKFILDKFSIKPRN